MAISRKKLDARLEKRILTGMIVSREYLKQIHPIFKSELFEVPFIATVAQWCIEHFEQYDAAPGLEIQNIYAYHAKNKLQEDQAELIAEFLHRLSSEWDASQDLNIAYLLDQTEQRFKERAMRMAMEDAEAYLSKGEILEAEKLLTGFKAPMRPSAVGVDPFLDPDAIYDAVGDQDNNTLFQLPGDLGKMLGPFERESFWGILAPEKRGKSWRMIDIANRAWKKRFRVALFQCGDMSQRATTARIHSNLTGRHPRYWGKYLMPVLDCAWNQDNSCSARQRVCDFGVLGRKGQLVAFEDAPDYVPCSFCQRKYPDAFKGAVWYQDAETQRLDFQYAVKHAQKLAKRYRTQPFKLSTYPTKTVNIKMVNAQLDIWESTEGWTPDFVIFDYADILAPEDPRKEFRHQQNESWEAMRALSLDRKCCVITATQASKETHKKRQVGVTDISEDKRKLAHVTNMIALNQTPEEKRAGIMRISQLAVREDEFDVEANVCVLQQLRVGNPCIASYFDKE